MSPSAEHEEENRTLAMLVELVAIELSLDVRNVGSMTFKRKDLQRGFEPATSFYIQQYERVRGRRRIDLAVDPPPDLLIEIEETGPALPSFRSTHNRWAYPKGGAPTTVASASTGSKAKATSRSPKARRCRR